MGRVLYRHGGLAARATGGRRPGRSAEHGAGHLRQPLPTVIIMAKVPVMGRVKTRLGREIGAVAATRFFRSAVRALVRRVGADPRWRTVLAIAPDPDVMSPGLPGGTARAEQGSGDLGQRMQRLLEGARSGGRALIIGTDIPAITNRDIARAFQILGRNDAVFGPAPDGGFWLVGYRGVPRVPRAFASVRWSSAHALADTIANLGDKVRVDFARTLFDVDDEESYRQVRSWVGRVVPPAHVQSNANVSRELNNSSEGLR